MSRIIIVSELFYPDGTSTAHILTKIADFLSDGHEVLVLAGPKSYSTDCVFDSSADEKPYPIKRIRIGAYNKNKLGSRAIRLIVSSMKLGILLCKTGKKSDHVLIVTNPAPFLLLASIIRRIKGFKLNILVHDVFPENAIAAGVIKSADNYGYKILRGIFKKAYQSADRLIVLGRDMQDVFKRKFSNKTKKPAIAIIENWADPNSPKIDDSLPKRNKIRILYAGNIGRCQGLECFIDKLMKSSNGNIEFVLRGGGAIVPEIESRIKNQNLPIVMGGPFSRDEQFEILSDCDISLVTLADGMCGLGVPSKSYNIMAAGKPILFIGDLKSEIALTINEYDLGYCFAPNDTAGLLGWIDSLTPEVIPELRTKGANALKVANTIFSEKEILNKYLRLFAES